MVTAQELHGSPETTSPFSIVRNIAEGLAPLTVASAGAAFLVTELLRVTMALASWVEEKVRESRERSREKIREEVREEIRQELEREFDDRWRDLLQDDAPFEEDA